MDQLDGGNVFVLTKDGTLSPAPNYIEGGMRVLWFVQFGMLHHPSRGGDYSYWDYKTALQTFLAYQQMGWDYVSLGPLEVGCDEQGFPWVKDDPYGAHGAL